MAINLDAMRKKLENSKSNKKSDSKESVFFKPEEGDQEIRFLPDGEDPFKEFFFHYGLGEAFLCPKRNFQDKCAVCDHAWKLWGEGTDESKKMAKDFFAKQRYFSLVVVRGKEAEGAKPYGYGKTTYQQLLDTILDPDYGDFTDPEKGRDFKLSYQKAEKKGAFPKTTLKIKPKESALLDSKKKITELLSAADKKPVESYLLKKTPAEAKLALETAMKDPYDDEESKYGNSKTQELTSDDDVDSAIDEALNS